jgi:hypothetical protein
MSHVQLEYGLPKYVFFGFAVFLVLLALADALYVMVLFQRGFIENLFPVWLGLGHKQFLLTCTLTIKLRLTVNSRFRLWLTATLTFTTHSHDAANIRKPKRVKGEFPVCLEAFSAAHNRDRSQLAYRSAYLVDLLAKVLVLAVHCRSRALTIWSNYS